MDEIYEGIYQGMTKTGFAGRAIAGSAVAGGLLGGGTGGATGALVADKGQGWKGFKKGLVAGGLTGMAGGAAAGAISVPALGRAIKEYGLKSSNPAKELVSLVESGKVPFSAIQKLQSGKGIAAMVGGVLAAPAVAGYGVQ